MDTLVRTALVGTTRQPDASAGGEAPTDALTSMLDGLTPERRILLSAGARAVYRVAGRMPGDAPAAPSPCPPESRPVCSPDAAQLISSLLVGSGSALLSEALGQLDRAGYVLPPELLVRALYAREDAMQAALRPVLGERGRWLARQNSAWQWAASSPSDDVPPDAEQIWQEGTPVQRRESLRAVRQADPARAREWLEAVWATEKAEMRCDLLGLLANNLSPDDEAILERALTDRAASVRTAAAPLLARLPGSAFARRMLERADRILACDDAGVRLRPPALLDDTWKRDGIQEQAPHGLGHRAWWATQVLSLVPPSHWRAQTTREPADLVRSLPKDDATVVMRSWSRAALLHDDLAWIPLLWDYWWSIKVDLKMTDLQNLASMLFARMPVAEVERRVLRDIEEQPTNWNIDLPGMLAVLPRPWSVPVARIYLDALRTHVATLSGAYQLWSDPFYPTLQLAAVALPVQVVPFALEPLPLADVDTVAIASWHDQLHQFAETLALRQRIYEEIPG